MHVKSKFKNSKPNMVTIILPLDVLKLKY